MKQILKSFLFLLLVCLSSINLLQAQEVSVSIKDSLVKIEKLKNKYIKATIYLNLASNLASKKLDTALFFLKKSEKLAKEINSSEFREKIRLNSNPYGDGKSSPKVLRILKDLKLVGLQNKKLDPLRAHEYSEKNPS